jgi:hypothetical protein
VLYWGREGREMKIKQTSKKKKLKEEKKDDLAIWLTC